MILHKGIIFKKFGENLPNELQVHFQEIPKLYQLYNAALIEICTKLEILDTELEISMDHNPIHHIESRLKSLRSIKEKLTRKDLPVDIESIRRNILDVAGIRVVCNYVEDIYYVSERLCKQSDVTTIATKDYIEHPKDNGYRSLHIITEVPVFLLEKTEMVAVEIQFRTVSMDVWANLEHEIKYKSNNIITEEIAMELKDCAIQLASVDSKMQNIYNSLNKDK